MRRTWMFIAAVMAGLVLAGCSQDTKPRYGVETPLQLPGTQRQVWAVAPVLDLSGRREVDPILQADLVFQQVQQVKGITAVPVNRVVQVFRGLGIERVASPQQAAAVCELLGCDALLVTTVTAYDPYSPPKMGAAMQLLGRRAARGNGQVDPRQLARQAAPPPGAPVPAADGMVQAVGMYDAANGSVRQAVMDYAQGRNDPLGPMGAQEYLASMDRYAGFVYHALLAEMLSSPAFARQEGMRSVFEERER